MILLVFVIIYIIFGGAVFRYVESEEDIVKETKTSLSLINFTAEFLGRL